MAIQNKGTVRNIIFFGRDDSFYDQLKPRFIDKYTQFEWGFHYIEEDPNIHVQAKFVDLIELKPVIIYFDFSSFSEKLKTLVEMVTKEPSFKNTAKVALCENKQSCPKYSALGLDLVYVKGAELHDFAFGPLCKALPDVAMKEQFATAKCEESVDLFSFGKIGFLTASYARIETNTALEEGNRVYIHHSIDKGILPSGNFNVKAVYDHDLHYPFNFAYDLDYHYVDEPTLDDDSDMIHEDGEESTIEQAKRLEEEREKRQELIDTFEHRLKATKKKFKEWVWDRVDGSKEKKLKVLVFDPKMRILKEESTKPVDSYPFSLRCFSTLSENLDEINKIRPGIIAIQMMGNVEFENRNLFLKAIEAYKNKESLEETGPPKPEWQMSDDEKEFESLKKNLPELESEDKEIVKKLIDKVKTIDKYNPIIVLLNCHLHSAVSLQQSFQYQMIMTNESEVSTMLIESMSTMFLKKQEDKYNVLMEQKLKQMKIQNPKKFQKYSVSDLKEKRFYLDKKDLMSIVKYSVPATITAMNESEITLTCDEVLRMATYYVESPFSMYLTFVPIEKGKPFVSERGINKYRALINGITEDDKKAIRQYVNDVFSSPKKEKEAQELESFQSLNDSVKQEREEEAKKRAEEAEEQLNGDTDEEEGDNSISDADTNDKGVDEAS